MKIVRYILTIFLFFIIAFPSEAVQYDLAFPGMLPDHQLYKLKVLRDKVRVMFTKDPQTRIRLHLLHADKGILATAILLEKGNVTLANQTALKAEHQITLLINYLPLAGFRKDSELLTKLKTASLKHQEVLGVLINRLPADSQETLKTVHGFSVRNLQSIEQFEKESL